MVYPFQNLVAWLTRDFGQHRCPLIIHPQGLDAAARSPELSKLSSFSPSDQYGLPLELWELIIDSLCDDVNALLACAATCSVFLRRSRHHLYKRVMLRTEDDANLFVQTLANDKANWDAVRELKLAGQLLCERDRNTTPLLFPMLRRLYTLVVYRLEQDALAHIHLFLAPVQQSITKFSLCAAHLPSFSSLSNLLLSFPHLRDLSLLGITFMQDVDVSTIKVYKPQLHLTLLDLSVPFGHGNYSYIQAMASWVCHVSFTTLCCLRLQLPLGAEMAGAAEQLVHANRATLHTLALDFGCSHWENVSLQLSENMALRRLQLRMPVTAAPTYVSLLRHLPYNTLEDLSLVFRAHPYWPPPRAASFANISYLRPIFAHEKFSGLRRLQVHCILDDGTHFRVPEDFPCRDLVLHDWLPDVAPRIWANDLEDTFDRVFEI